MSNKNRQQQQVKVSETAEGRAPDAVDRAYIEDKPRGPLADAVRVCLRGLLMAARYGTVKRDMESEIQAAIESLE
jgi:hypothetical protein